MIRGRTRGAIAVALAALLGCEDGSGPDQDSGLRYQQVVTGFLMTCALATTGDTYCWGNARFSPDSIPRKLATPEPLSEIASGSGNFNQSVCGIGQSGRMYCWGEYLGGTDVGDQYGDGIGVVVMADSFRFLTLAAGNGHVCGVATTTETICWGSYLSGKRGQNGPYELNNEGSSFSDLNANAVAGGQSFIRLAAGDRQTCGISAAGNLFCWGDSVSVGVPGFAFEQADSLCYDSDACAMTPVLVPQLFSIASAEAGGAQTCALTTTGTVFCWGYNYYGEVGNGSSAPQSSPVVIDIGEPAQAISAGGFHTCALGLSGSAYCWGVNELGQLGFAGPDHPTPRKVLFHKNFVSLSAGVAHTCGISVEGFIYCWGDNQAGELGNGSTVSSPFPQKVVEP